MTCPNCQSNLAVSKVEAWDAACAIPKKVEKVYDELLRLEMTANKIVNSEPKLDEVSRMVSLSLLKELESYLVSADRARDLRHTPHNKEASD